MTVTSGMTSSGVTHLIGGEEPHVSLAHLAVHVVVVVLVHAVARVRVAVEVVALQYVLGDRSEASHTPTQLTRLYSYG